MGVLAPLRFGPLRVEVWPDGLHRTLTDELPIWQDGKVKHIVPSGFITDFASVPRGLWNLFPPSGRYTPAAVYHDHLYRLGTTSREYADAEFLAGMTALEVPWWQRTLMYWAVRLFGRSAWDEAADERILSGEDE